MTPVTLHRSPAVVPASTFTHHTASKPVKKPASKPAPAPAPAPPAPAPKPAPVAAAPAPAPKPAPAPAPVVKPVPDSSVSSLAPSSTSTSSGSGTSSPSSGSTGSTQPSSSSVSYTSTNWSGYLATSVTYSGIAGSWKAPAATGTSGTESGDATWIGIGGVTSEDLIQVGTEDVVAADGTVSTGAFYELLPDAAQDVPGFTVSPGDSISASLAQVSASRWTISISNTTTSASWSTTVTYTSSRSSAEWIEEDPSYAAGGQVPFDNFGTVNFTGGSVTPASGGTQTIAGAGSSAITMVNSSNQHIAVPSALGSDGASFSITRLNAN